MKKAGIKIAVHRLTPDLWPAFEDLFGDSAVCGRCWCMYWRIGAAYRKQSSAKNKAALKEVVQHGPPPGLLAFVNEVAVGWCQITPRDEVPELDRNKRLKRVDDLPVWSITCFYVRKGFRKKGVTKGLLMAALKMAKRAGAPAVEAYPLDRDLSPSSTSTGVVSTFERAGFKIVARHFPPRPIMRHDLKKIGLGVR